MHVRFSFVSFSVIVFCLGLAGPIAADDVSAHFARKIWTGDGVVLRNAVLLVREGKIIAVGPREKIDIPPQAEKHYWGDAVLAPGFVIAETTLAGRGRNSPRSLASNLLSVENFDFFANRLRLLQGGVTTVHLSPSLGRLLPGRGGVVKLAGDSIPARTLIDQGRLHIVLSSGARNPPRVFDPPVGAVSVDRPLDPTKPQLARSLAGAVAGLRAVFRAAEKYQPLTGANSGDHDLEEGLFLKTIAEQRASGAAFRIKASTAAEIRAAFALAKEFDFKILLEDAKELPLLWRQRESWQGLLHGVVLPMSIRPGQITNPSPPDPKAPQPVDPWRLAAMLRKAEIPTAMSVSATDDLSEVLFLGGLLRRGGLSDSEALAMLTKTPAQLLGVDKRVGVLAANKDADFLVLTDDPFARRSQVKTVFVEGKKVFQDRLLAQNRENGSSSAIQVLRADVVYDGKGGRIEGGSLVVEEGKIRAVGRDVSAPLTAGERRFSKAVIVPGFLDLGTNLGVGSTLSSTVTLQTKLSEQISSTDDAIAIARQGGITTVLLTTTSRSPSPAIAFKLGKSLRVLQEPVALRFAVTGNLTSSESTLQRTLTSAKRYVDRWTNYEKAKSDYQKKLKEYEAAQKKAQEAKKDEKKEDQKDKKPHKKPDEKSDEKPAEEKDKEKDKKEEKEKPKLEKPKEPTKPTTSANLEPYRLLFSGKIPALVEARKIHEIRLALKVFRDQFKLRTILLGADDIARDPHLLKDKDVAVVAGPTLVGKLKSRPTSIPQVLASQGIAFGFQSQGRTGVKQLPLAVQFAVHKGLGAEDALFGLTSQAAKMLNLDGSLGTLTPGKDADLVVLSGEPFDAAAEVLAVMIDGDWVYEKPR